MAKINIGMAFSRELEGVDPLGHIGIKKPVYLRFFDLCEQESWGCYVLTRKTYEGDGIFNGAWKYVNGNFEIVKERVKINLVYDRCAGVKFPPTDDNSVVWVNEPAFKVLAWNKWAAYQVIGEYMPKTILVDSENEVPSILPEIKTEKIVLKPFNGLKGLGIFIGSKEDALKFKFVEKYKRYVAQEFVDTSNGIPGICKGMHDLRIVVINGKVVWCHVREPVGDSLLANAAQGGNLTEVDYDKVPQSVKGVVDKVSARFSADYDNPIYSLDFGIHKDGTPRIFEINDQMGFPQWDMKNREVFLNELITNFKQKLVGRTK